jgi:hypothetical protein
MRLLLAPIKLAFWFTVVLVVAVVVAYFAVRGRVTPESLAHSVRAEVDASSGGSCREDARGWRCPALGQSGGNDYRVRVDGRCWTARRIGPSADGLPRRARGCVGLWDQVRLADRI